jgi:hypothetical protein
MQDIKQADADLAAVIESEPAVPVESVPEEVTRSNQNDIQDAPTHAAAVEVAKRFIQDADVAEAVATLSRWRTRRNNSENQYQNSFRNHARNCGYTKDDIEEKPRITWGGGGGTRIAIPDLILRNRVLVELKADLMASGEVDRAMGQMLRYLLAWKNKGPALLVVCGDVSPEIRFLVHMYITTWRQTVNLPVTVLFKQFPVEVIDDMPLEPALLSRTI